MVTAPVVRYAKVEDTHIAFQVMGSGPPDLLTFAFSGVLPIDSYDEEPALARFEGRLASFSRLIRFDVRGVGMSDPVTPADPPTLEQWAQDALAVLDAAGSNQAALLASGTACAEALLLATTNPHRISHLVIVNGTPRVTRDADYSIGASPDAINTILGVNIESDALEHGYDHLARLAPSVAGDASFRAWFNRAGSRGASPATARAILKVRMGADVRGLLPLVQVPTLVLHRRDAPDLANVEHGRFLAAHIPGARFVELEGADHLCWVGDTGQLLAEIEEFLTGQVQVPATDRVLATILFTDIVGSTKKAAQIGDRHWHDLLDSHDQVVRDQLERFGGREVDKAGDGFLALFDGPGRGIGCARAICDAVRALGIEVRAGLHTGEIEVRSEGVAGMAIHIGARVAACAGPSQILVSGAIPPLVVGSGLEFEDRGEHELKGVPGLWRLFAVKA